MFIRSRSAPLLHSDGIPDTRRRETFDIREDWLNEVCPLLNNYDAKLLRRSIRFLPFYTLAKIWTDSHYEYLQYLANKRENGEADEVSKMAMRRVLESTFERLSSGDEALLAVYRNWQATKDKSNRKSKSAATRHRIEWRNERS